MHFDFLTPNSQSPSSHYRRGSEMMFDFPCVSNLRPVQLTSCDSNLVKVSARLIDLQTGSGGVHLSLAVAALCSVESCLVCCYPWRKGPFGRSESVEILERKVLAFCK
jgi:hypothetical protein